MSLSHAIALSQEILIRLNGAAPMSASELAFLVKAEVSQVQSLLGAMVREGAVARLHISDGTLRYRSLHRPPPAPPQEPAPVPITPGPAPRSPGTARPLPRSIGVNLDILVDSAVHEIDNIMASDAVLTARAGALAEVNDVLRGHLERVALLLLAEEASS